MRYLLTCFGPGNPEIALDLPDHAIYPVSNKVTNGLDLDLTALLLGEEFLIDDFSLSYLRERAEELSFLRPLLRSLDYLAREGILTTFSGTEIIEANNQNLKRRVDHLLRQPEPWIQAMRSQWRALSNDRDDFVNRYGTKERRELNEVHFTIANALYKRDGEFNARRTQNFSQQIANLDFQLTDDVIEIMVEALRPLVSHIVIQDLFRSKTGAIPLDWEDSNSYYEELLLPRWDVDAEQEQLMTTSVRQMFNVALPALKPGNVEEIVGFIRKKGAVASLRNELKSLLEQGTSIDPNWASRYQIELQRAELSNNRTMQKMRYATKLLATVVPATGLASLGMDAGIEVLEKTQDMRVNRTRPTWYYALLDPSKDPAPQQFRRLES